MYRSINRQVFLRKGVLNICSKFTGKHPCQSVISIKLLCNFIEITLRHECFPVNLLHIFRTAFSKNTSGWLLLERVHFDKSFFCRACEFSWTQQIHKNNYYKKYLKIKDFSLKKQNLESNFFHYLTTSCHQRLQQLIFKPSKVNLSFSCTSKTSKNSWF